MSPRAQTVDTLCQLMSTGDEADRCYAARTLGVLGDPTAVDTLTAKLQDEDIDVCVDAAEALGRIGSPRAVPPLIESLTNDPNGEICTAVTKALGNLGGEEAAQALRVVAEKRPEGMEWDEDWDTWWDVQREAVKALGRFGDDQAIEILTGILNDESQQDIESEILRALAGTPGKGTDVLIARLQDSDSRHQQRWRSAKALGQASRNEKITQALGRALKDKVAVVRAEVAAALAEQNATRYLPALMLMLRDSSENVRSSAIKAIIQLSDQNTGDELVREKLLAMVGDSSPEVRATLFNALSRTVEANALPDEAYSRVAADLVNPYAETASAACTLLGKNGDDRAVSELLRVLDDDQGHPMVRREAARMVGRLGIFDEAVSECMTRVTGSDVQAVRLAALTALVELDKTNASTDAPRDCHSPMEIILGAIEGRIQPGQQSRQGTTAESNTGQSESQSTADSLSEAPETAALPAESTTETLEDVGEKADGQAQEPNSVALPDTPARIVEEGEIKSAVSTLDAIAMDNVEATLGLDTPPPEQDEETLEYLAVADANKETMSRIRSERKIDPALDTRRLGIRVLGECDGDEGIKILIRMLQDANADLRGEAAVSIGRIAERNPGLPALMDAVGLLITQMTMDNQDQRLRCALALGRLGNRAAVVPLLEVLKDPKPNVRIQAIKALSLLYRQGTDQIAPDHMVTRKVPPLSVSRSIAELLNDEEAGVRVAASKALAIILEPLEEKRYTAQIIETIIDSVFSWTGEEARLIGKTLRGFDTAVATDKLLQCLKSAEDSVKRSVVIEMLEELLDAGQEKKDRVA
ncbi:MAG: HEAT repeat domain-containing protein [Gammaproteobacteria bacterium]|nr:HEAT repeat domain-containing protein [Gammaproteobacteria bacterium]